MSKEYRIADPRTHKIIISRDVVFLKGKTINSDPNYINFHSVEVKEESENEFNTDNDDDDDDQSDRSESPGSSTTESDDEFFEVPEEPEIVPRRSNRANLGRPPHRFDDYHVYSVVEKEFFESKTYEKAVKCPENQWISTIQEELASIERNDTWELVDLPSRRNTIGSKWVFKLKNDESTENRTYKARLVAQGFSQKFGVDYDEVFAPVARSETLRVLLTVAGTKGFNLKQYDFKTAFLNGELKEEIYMRPPKGVPSNGKVFKLKKSLYGLKQAAKVWHESLNGKLIKHGCVQGQPDKCLYIATRNESKLYLIVHVDDLLVTFNDEQLLETIISAVREEYELKDLGTARQYLGIDIERSQDGVFIIKDF